MFSDYISNVLPELGEKTVPETSMEQILSGVLEHKYKYQTYFGLVNELLEKPSSSLIDRIAYKASFGFISELDKFILHIENTYFKAALPLHTRPRVSEARVPGNALSIAVLDGSPQTGF